MSKHERTGWRDCGISEWHRNIGRDCPAVDLDTIITHGGIVDDAFSLCEYDHCEPVAIIDYKHERARLNFAHSTIVTQATLATMAKLPSFVVVYADDRTLFTLYPTNDKARKMIPNRCQLSERNFIRFLYYLRGRRAPDDVLQNATDFQPTTS